MRFTLPEPQRGMLERLAFLIFLCLITGSCGLFGLGLILGFHPGDFRPAILGAMGLILAMAVRSFGYRHLHFRECEDSMELNNAGGFMGLDPEHEERARVFRNLLREYVAVSRRYAAGEVDVWAVQRLRNSIVTLLESDPELREEFAGELEEHPEF